MDAAEYRRVTDALQARKAGVRKAEPPARASEPAPATEPADEVPDGPSVEAEAGPP
jgi:hypothetical protein